VDAFAAAVTARYPQSFACARGCSTCCHQHLSVLPVEFARLTAAVRALDATSREAIRVRLERGRADPRCPLLDDEGACRTYAARPLICRTHGLPIQLTEPAEAGAPQATPPVWRDVCPLNFTGSPGLAELPAGDVLDVGRLNATLVLIDRLAEGEGQTGEGQAGDAPRPAAPRTAEGRVDLFDGLGWVLADARLAGDA